MKRGFLLKAADKKNGVTDKPNGQLSKPIAKDNQKSPPEGMHLSPLIMINIFLSE